MPKRVTTELSLLSRDITTSDNINYSMDNTSDIYNYLFSLK